METETVKLPREPIKSEVKSPNNLIIFSKPKVGKTTLLSKLENCLILDLEDGSDFVDALKIKAHSLKDIKSIGEAIKQEDYPYKYIAVDTVTKLEDMCLPYAEDMYSKSPMGKGWFTEGKKKYSSLLNLPNGTGYFWLREAFINTVNYIGTLAPRIILVGHIKDAQLEKGGVEFTSADLDLTGKIKRITASASDAIGYLTRKGNQSILSFKSSDEIACGARPSHLRGQEIVLGEEIEGELITHWNKIFID